MLTIYGVIYICLIVLKIPQLLYYIMTTITSTFFYDNPSNPTYCLSIPLENTPQPPNLPPPPTCYLSTTVFNVDNNQNPTIVKKELTPHLIIDTIRKSIVDQFKYNFGEKPSDYILEILVDGFMLFNLHKNKYMFKNKNELIKYVNDNNISLEEKSYFTNIVLYTQKPNFCTCDEIEQIRACGNLDDDI